MKKSLLKWAESQLRLRRMTKNGLSAEDAAVCDEIITDLQALVDELKASGDEVNVSEAIDAMKGELDKRIKVLEEKIAGDAVQEPKANNVNGDYLKGEGALHDWCDAIRTANAARHAGKTGDMDAYRKAWGDHLTKNGITIVEGKEEAYLPAPVKSAIEDMWNAPTNWVKDLHATGAKRFNILYNTETQDDTDSRARGHKKGETKTEQELTLSAKLIEGQFIYKLISLDNETVYNDDAQLVKYVTTELVSQIIYEIGRCVLIGDGRSSGTPDLRIKSIESVKRASTDEFVTVGSFNSSVSMVENIMEGLVKNIEGSDPIYLFLNKADSIALRKVELGTNATPQYVSLEAMAAQLGVARIIEMPIMDSSTASAARAIAMQPAKYFTVGSLNPSFVSWEEYKTNEQCYRAETWYGGAVGGLKSAAVLLNPES